MPSERAHDGDVSVKEPPEVPGQNADEAETIAAVLNAVRHVAPEDRFGFIMVALAAEIAAWDVDMRAEMLDIVARNVPYLVEQNLALAANSEGGNA